MGIFIRELGFYIPMMGFLKCPRSSWASKLDAHPLVFFCWAFIALVHPLHENPYSSCWHQLMGISIARWLSSSMWDFLLFCLLQTIPIIVFYSTHSAISMAHAHVLRESWKSLRLFKYGKNCLACHRGCRIWEHFCVTKMKHSLTIWFCRDNILWSCYFEKTWLLS